jgi:general secretion pathway protein J
MTNRMKSGAGFTLVEVLVALTLMALMGVVCWRGLSFVADQRAGIERESVDLADLMHAFAQLERDVDERLPDIAAPARATAPELPLAMSIVPTETGVELEVLRAVPTGVARSDTVPVIYRLGREGLVRTSPGGDVLVLPGVTRLQFRLYAGGFWVDYGRLDPGSARTVQPAIRPFAQATALEIAVEDAKGGRYVKVLLL